MRHTLRGQWIAAAPLLAWSVLIFGLSSVPGGNYPQVSFEHADKLVHVSLYLVLGLFSSFCFAGTSAGLVGALIYGLLFGLSDELHQIFVPQRSCSVGDWLADATGVFMGVGLFLGIKGRLRGYGVAMAFSEDDQIESLEQN